MGGKKGKGYKRSWRNLLLDKGYQLRFSLFMAGMAAVLMFLLGWWVMDVAGQATKVSKQGVAVCTAPASIKAGALNKVPAIPPATDDEAPTPPVPDDFDGKKDGDEAKKDTADGDDAKKDTADDAKKDTADGDDAKKDKADDAKKDKADDANKDGDDANKDGDDAGGDGDGDDAGKPKVTVTLDEGDNLNDDTIVEMLIDVDKVVDYFNCRMITRAQINDLDAGERLIFWVLIAVGLVLVFGLTLYGLKMTHKVAGPLHKVSLYMEKMKKGRYDTVWNLRKGDQLVEFYEHFKGAHAGIKTMQNEDIEQLRGVIEAADAADLASKSPELAAVLDEMREALARKEKGLE